MGPGELREEGCVRIGVLCECVHRRSASVAPWCAQAVRVSLCARTGGLCVRGGCVGVQGEAACVGALCV